MARLRTIKPEFWTSEQVVECSRDSRLLFIGLWNFSDDRGIHPCSIKRIKMEIFPGDFDVTEDSIRRMLDELIENELICLYIIDSKEYLIITGWGKHQRIDKPTYRYPEPTDESLSQNHKPLDERSTNDLPRSGVERSGVESNGKDVHTPVKSKKSSATYSENFNRFWLTYPQARRKEKPKAGAAWKSQKCEPIADKIISKLQTQITQDRDFLDGFEPYPERYLKNRKFEDEINTRPPNGRNGPIPAAEARRRAKEAARQQANATSGRTFDESGQEVFS